MLCCLAGVSEPLVNILLGEKWHFTSILIIPLCFSVMWYPVASINLNLLQVKGRSDLFLKLEIIKKIIGVAILVLSFPFGLVVMCYARIISTIISLMLNTYYTGKLIQVGFWLQLKDMSATLITSFLMFLNGQDLKMIKKIRMRICVLMLLAPFKTVNSSIDSTSEAAVTAG